MICPTKSPRALNPAEIVSEILQNVYSDVLTLELITDPAQEARWNKLIQEHHYLKEYRMVGESLRYVAKLNGKWIALLGWPSRDFHVMEFGRSCLLSVSQKPCQSGVR